MLRKKAKAAGLSVTETGEGFEFTAPRAMVKLNLGKRRQSEKQRAALSKARGRDPGSPVGLRFSPSGPVATGPFEGPGVLMENPPSGLRNAR